MLYLVTDQNCQTWREVQWGINVTHIQTNPNYHFPVYDNLSVAAYMYPAYDGIENPKIWEAIGEGESRSQTGFRNKYAKLTTLREIPFQIPTIEQRISFAILCSMNLVLNPLFQTWALNYLRNVDRTKETAHVVSEEISKQSGSELPLEHQYTDCAYAVLAAVLFNHPGNDTEVAAFTANAAHRAYFDSLDQEINLNLENLIQIVDLIPLEEIAQILGS